MPNVYVEPRPKERPEGTPITDYFLEFAGGQTLGQPFKTQAEAAAYAREMGHHPLCARDLQEGLLALMGVSHAGYPVRRASTRLRRRRLEKRATDTPRE